MSLILLDTNIIIRARQPDGAFLANILEPYKLATNRIIEIEVLCGGELDDEDFAAFKVFLDSMRMLELDSRVARQAIDIRKRYRTKLPDALIAATAIVHRIPLWTHNSKDFKSIRELTIYDPIKGGKT